MLATEYASYYKIAPQRDNETDNAFRHRVSGALRDMGHIIEAHEAFRGEFCDQSNDAITGCGGSVGAGVSRH